MKESAQAPPVRSRSRTVVTGIVQLVSAIVATLAASWLWQVANNQESRLGADFWGFIAVASFCSVAGILNLVFPLIRSTFPTSRQKRQCLARPLSSISGNWEVTRELFGFGLAFLAPVIPFAFLTLRMYQADFDLTILGVGATIGCTVLGGLLLFITSTQLYTMIVAGETSVEIACEPLQAGDDAEIFVSYEPGRLDPHHINVRVVCNKTRNRHVLPNKKRRWGSQRPTIVELYAATVHAEVVPSHAHWPWEYAGTLTIPHNAQRSFVSKRGPDIEWFIEVNVGFLRAPDIQLVYPLRVV